MVHIRRKRYSGFIINHLIVAACLACAGPASVFAHGEGLQSGAGWSCPLDVPLFDQSGVLGITLLDEMGIDAPNVALTFEDGTRMIHILRSNWADGLVFRDNTPNAAELTLIRNAFNPRDFNLMIWQPATDTRQTIATCEET